MDIAAWLRGLELEQYAPTFHENGIDERVLPKLTAEDLKDLGITMVGHRRVLLEAIAALREPAAPAVKAGAEALDAAPMPGTRAASNAEAERRQVTVMFCDLVGSTAMASRLDPEDLRDLIGSFQHRVAQTVARFDGFVAKYMGDGVLVYFGYPHAHEDDAEQAVRAGLALIDAVGELQAAEPLQVRIGVATGLVVVGDLIGAGSAQEQAVVGETPNLAARLQALADPGAIVIAESTRQQIGSLFEIHDLGPLLLKGFAQPHGAWRVLCENRALGRFEALRSGTTPLIGRDEELELLLRRWAQAKAGSGRVVLISAEPGVGKSRLTEALAERIAAEPHIRLRYFCSPHHQDSALYPVIAQLERAAGFEREDTPEARLIKLEALLAQSSATEEETALIAGLLSLAPGERYRLPEMSAQRRKERTMQALLVQAERLSAQQPVLTIFEDVHWIDPTSLELLTLSVERKSVPVLLVATFRPEFQPRWTGQPHVMALALTRLDRGDTAAMIANIAGNAALPTEIVQEIAERTDGVPLFVEELTKAVLESGSPGAAALSAAPHPALSVPATLHASLMARLDRLGPAAKDVAQKGAVIGREFGYELLASIADLPEPQLQDMLDRLSTSGLLFVRGTPPQSTYLFKHALVQDAAYGTLLRSRRQELHGRIGTALEANFPEIASTRPELMGYHFGEAGSAERAVRYWSKAGRQNFARSSMIEAEALLRKGLDCLSRLPDSVLRQELELDLQITLARALMAVHGWGALAVAEGLTRARQLCEELNRTNKLLPILLGQWTHHGYRGDLEMAQQLALEMRQLGETQDDVIARAVGCRVSGQTCLYLGEFTAARAYHEEALALYDPAHRLLHADVGTVDELVLLLLLLSLTLVHLGHLDQARLHRDAALAEARQLSHAHTLASAFAMAEWIGWLARSEPASLSRYSDELSVLSADQGFGLYRVVALVARGWCMAASGCADEGIPLLTASLADLQASGVALGVPRALTRLADAYRIAGQPQAALAKLTEAERLAEATHERWVIGETLRLKGDVLMQTGDHGAAEASFRDAIALAQQQDAKLFELRSATSLARLWRDQGKTADAQALLAPIYNWFTEGFDAPDLIEAKALLDALVDGAGAVPPDGAAAVSDRPSSG